MHTFTMAGREWSIDLTIGLAKRLKGTPVGEDWVRVDLLRLWDGNHPMVSRLAADMWLLVDVLYVVAEPRDGVRTTDEEFATLLTEGFPAASRAFWDDLVDFFQRLGQPQMSEAITAKRELIHAGIEWMRRTVKSLETAAVAKLAVADNGTPGNGSPSRPESSALTRPRSRSGDSPKPGAGKKTRRGGTRPR